MVPAVFAEERTKDIDEIRVDKRIKREIAPFTGRVSDDIREERAERVEKVLERRAERVEKVLERRENAVEKRTKARELSRTKIKLHREKLVVAKEKAAEAKERYKDSKGKAVAARKRLADCDADVQDCAAVQAEFTGHFKDALLRTIEHLGDIVDQVEARIASSEDVTEGESSEELARISELRLQLQELASQVGQLPEDADKSELRAIVKAVKNELRDIQKDLKHSASVVVSGRLGGIIVRAGQMETKLDQVLAWADKKGIAVGDIDALVDSFHNYLADAKDAFEDAESARRSGNKEAFVENLKASKNSLKDAHSVLMEIMKGIRQHNLEGGLEETETVKPKTSNEADEVDELVTKVEVEGEISSNTQALVDALVASLEGVEVKVELKLKVEKKDNSTVVERDEVGGTLTSEQESLWADLKTQVIADLEASEEDEAEIEIEIEHELEVEAEDVEDESELEAVDEPDAGNEIDTNVTDENQ